MPCPENCCTFPQGRRAVHALLWSIFAFLFCLSAGRGCYFMKIDGYLITINPFLNSDENLGSSSIGLFGYEEIGSDSNGFVCVKYSSTQIEYFIDAPWKAARAFAILAVLCSSFTLLCLIMSSCFAFSPIILQSLAGVSCFGGLSVMLTFIMFASKVSDEPFNGSLNYGGAMTIIGSILSVVTGVLILQIRPPNDHTYIVREPTNTTSNNNNTQGSRPNHPPPPRRNFPPAKRVDKTTATPSSPAPVTVVPKESARDIEAFQPGTETITETILPDGTKKVVTTVIDTDGTTTVTETITRIT